MRNVDPLSLPLFKIKLGLPTCGIGMLFRDAYFRIEVNIFLILAISEWSCDISNLKKVKTFDLHSTEREVTLSRVVSAPSPIFLLLAVHAVEFDLQLALRWVILIINT